MEMVGLIQNAITSMQTGTEAPAVGWMFNSLFGIQATEDLNDRGIGRPQEQMEALAKMQNLLTTVEKHSNGAFQLPTFNGVLRNTRIFCSHTWLLPTDRRINPATRVASIPFFFLPGNGLPVTTFWYDFEIDFYVHPTPNLARPELLICGANNAASASTENNAITFCPMQFGIFTTSADYPNQPTLDALSPDLIGAFGTVSASFLHEYTHIVGRGIFGNAANPIPDVNLFPEHYGFPAASQLPTSLGISNALKNADSYALLGVALKLSQCDWRNGACHSPAYWAALRRQTLAAAQLLLGIGSTASGP
ncbi:hypothetical protein BGZ57DRAFT_898299 [Hyaloscypha finlandica]|nr:hypothetical protein BGZ57DRAFT_898299 [Hyaloscypha finlandica]